MTSKIKKDPSISKQMRMVIDVIHTANWLDEKISGILNGFGITHPQFNILKNIQAAHPEPLSVKEIKESIMFTKSDVTRLIDRLVYKGLLIRNTCPVNRRKMDISMTKKGTKMLNGITPEFQKAFGNSIDKEISIDEALNTSDILRIIRK